MRKLSGWDKFSDSWLRVLQSDVFWAAMLLTLIASAFAGCTTAQQIQELPITNQIQLAVDSQREVTRQVRVALEAGRLSPKLAGEYLELAESSRVALGEARALADIDLSGADAKLRLATEILTRLEAYLLEQQK